MRFSLVRGSLTSFTLCSGCPRQTPLTLRVALHGRPVEGLALTRMFTKAYGKPSRANRSASMFIQFSDTSPYFSSKSGQICRAFAIVSVLRCWKCVWEYLLISFLNWARFFWSVQRCNLKLKMIGVFENLNYCERQNRHGTQLSSTAFRCFGGTAFEDEGCSSWSKAFIDKSKSVFNEYSSLKS